MTKSILGLIAAATVATAMPAAAQAQPWQNIDARQDRLYTRIEQGVRSGALTRREAQNLRGRFQSLTRLEHQYRRTGGRLDRQERADLNRRYDQLAASVRYEKRDWQRRG